LTRKESLSGQFSQSIKGKLQKKFLREKETRKRIEEEKEINEFNMAKKHEHYSEVKDRKKAADVKFYSSLNKMDARLREKSRKISENKKLKLEEMRNHDGENYGTSSAYDKEVGSQPNASFYGSMHRERARTTNMPGSRAAVMAMQEKKEITRKLTELEYKFADAEEKRNSTL